MPTRECYYSEYVICRRDNPPTDEECKECMKYHELRKGIINPDMPIDDKVAHPSHYVEGRKYEPKDVIRDWGLNYNLGCVVKYVSRAGRKDDILQDLKKARQYLSFEIEALEEEKNES